MQVYKRVFRTLSRKYDIILSRTVLLQKVFQFMMQVFKDIQRQIVI